MTDVTATSPTKKMSEIDDLRLQMIAFLYAAAVGYGFAVLDSAPGKLMVTDWDAATDPNEWRKCLSSHGLGLWLYLNVFVFVAIDWLYSRAILVEGGSYGKPDFVVDMLIVFLFVRMMHAAAFALGTESGATKCSYWVYLAIMFSAYLFWDLIRVWVSWQPTKVRSGAKITWRDLCATVWKNTVCQRWALFTDFLGVFYYGLMSWFSHEAQPKSSDEINLALSPVMYWLIAITWGFDKPIPSSSADSC